MKNIFNKIKLIASVVLVSMYISCDSILEQDETDFGTGPVVVQFENNSVTANFLQTEENPVYIYTIPLEIIGGINEPLDHAVNITVSIDPNSTAIEGNEYIFSGNKDVTLAAGEMSINVEVSVLSENLDPFDPKTLILQIESTSEIVSDSNKTSVTFQAACILEVSSFVGTYTALQDGDTYTVNVIEGPEANTLELTNLYDTGGRTIIELGDDPTNPIINFRSEELDAALYVDATYGDLWATTITPESSSYISCSNYMLLEFKRCVGAGCFAGSEIIALTKQ
ncbi:hypothetical protein I2486_01665 [Cellulophaga sp. E16_2]|uniref:hypothetical protein n=1 Tax=Cellulophaga sp. E16_2 TaxID=2789297 RepID=UPI001A9230BC|nr:hypothetical protein [Cellulophaga sp. E16_2]MBO0590103.1 hypothetical protein [Cellulophaga sp. E16_2]